ncbi:cysteine desulfurase family protein [Microbacterium sp. BR1]|uniref:cysteine desulfurase family protein n=1 Tax=Microbacterium sp. BR1 TaxID=1070896 RepID=UPI000C2C3244|nr:cysteine desulfurase family protein [Microbacterium sp. BR1]
MLYLDNAATTPVRREALDAMLPYVTTEFGNPSSHHTVGERAAEALATARAAVGRALGMRQSDVVFTSGGTEANNLAVKGIAIAARLARDARHVITTPIEHESILESVDYLRRVHGFAVTQLPVDAFGRVDPADLQAALRDDTALVTLGYANNEIGTIQDVSALAAIARGRRVPIHIDAVQAAGWLDLSAADLGVDAISIAGHKVGAPAGTGVLAVRGRVPLEPLMHGGGQERGRRSGTENVAGAVALATALTLAETERADASARVAALRDGFIARVLDTVPTARLTGDPAHRLPGTASFTFAGTSGEAVLLELERRGIVSSSGSACAAGSDEPSHVLLAVGIPAEVAQTSVRFTFSARRTDSLETIAAAHTLADAVAASVSAVQSAA